MGEDENGQKNTLDNNNRELEKFRIEINDSIKSNQKARDQMVLAMSAALFGLMSFILDKLQTTCCFQILVFLLLLFNLSSLLTTLLSFHLSERGCEEDFKLCEQQGFQFRQSCWTSAGNWCNKLSSIFMALTLMLLATILFLHFSTKPQEAFMKEAESNATNSSPQNPSTGVGLGNESVGYGVRSNPSKQPQQDRKDCGDTTNKDKNDKKQ